MMNFQKFRSIVWLWAAGFLFTPALLGQGINSDLLELLKANQFQKALELIDQLPEKDSARIRYWQACCLAARGKIDDAINTCHDVTTRWPDTSYASDANLLKDVLNDHAFHSNQITTACLETLQTIRDTEGPLHVSLKYKGPTGNDTWLRFAIDFANQECCLQVTQDNQIVYQIASGPDGSRWYRKEDHRNEDEPDGEQVHQILEFKESFFPSLSFNIEKMPDESFKIGISGKIVSRAQDSNFAWKKLLANHWFSTAKGCHEFLVIRSRQKGTFPGTTLNYDDKVVCDWWQPDFEKGGLSASTYELTTTGIKISNQNASSTFHLYVDADHGGSVLDKFDWPDVAVARQEIDIPFVKQFVQSLQELGFEGEPANSTASRKKELR